jgi:hypothetical protein
MTERSYSQMGADDLIKEFIRVAKTLGPFGIPQARTPERTAAVGMLRTITAELGERAPAEKLRPLFDHESNDVRGFAAFFLLAVDEDRALATVSALGAGLSTREMMALCDRARRGPPAGPAVKDMATEQLAARYEDAGIRQYATRFMGGESEPWDVELCNQIIGEIVDIMNELRSRDEVAALLPFLDHANVTVRGTAAANCLSIAPERAVPVLQAIVTKGDQIDKDGASWALARWRKEI